MLKFPIGWAIAPIGQSSNTRNAANNSLLKISTKTPSDGFK
jgi:hypothetical protein